jgi:beta-lactamase regulating signal transducer with metallopeptidase domain
MTAWLLSWLWQGMAVAVAVSVGFRLLPRINAATRYLIWWGALVALAWLGLSSSPHATSLIPAVASSVAIPTPLVQIRALPSGLLVSFLALWLGVAFVKLCRVISGMRALYALHDRCRLFQRVIEERLLLWQAAKTNGRRVRLMLCDNLSGAAVLGLHRPCIALPSSLIDAMTIDELDQVILHEYGHVQRYDDWMRLVQTLLEAALWIHPAAFWIVRELDLEREVACDDWVIERTGRPKVYARCLSRAAEVRSRIVQAPFVPSLFGRKRDLRCRIERLLNVRRTAKATFSWVAGLAGVCGLATISLHLPAFQLIGEERIVDRRSSIVDRQSSIVDRQSSIVDRQSIVDGSMVEERAAAPSSAQAKSTVASLVGDANIAVHLEVDPTEISGSAELAVESGFSRTEKIPEQTTPSVPGARSFNGVYPSTGTPAGRTVATPVASRIGAVQRSEREEPTPWEMAGTAGAGIGAAAKTSSVGIANTFTRAGVSVARRFQFGRGMR